MTSSTRSRRLPEGVAHVVVLVADDGFARHFDAQLIQALGEEQGIGVHAVGREQFRADGDDFSFHDARGYAADSGKAFDVPVEAEERAGGGEHGAARGQQRQADQAAAAQHQFGLAIGRDAHDAAASADGSGDVEIAGAVEGQALRPAEAAIEEAHFALAVDAADAVEARSGRAGDEEFARGAERQMIGGDGRLERGEDENFAVGADLENGAAAVADEKIALRRRTRGRWRCPCLRPSCERPSGVTR